MPVRESISKGRSPKYPRISLDTAVVYARRMYENAHRTTLDPDTAARVMGFSGKSGASAVALGAVRQFGLVDGLRGSMRISDLALRILQPSSRQEEVDARHEAAFSPEIYDSVVSHFDGELPKSDDAIKAFLIRSLGFSQSGADDCIGTLRKTIDELDAYQPEPSIAMAPIVVDEPTAPSLPPKETKLTETSPASQSSDEFVRIPLARDCYAELRLYGTVTDSAVDRLVQYIQLMKGAWAES